MFNCGQHKLCFNPKIKPRWSEPMPSIPHRKFPSPWSVQERPASAIAESGRLTRDEAKRIATNIAKLPELLKGRTKP
jgi:hypothetical protein